MFLGFASWLHTTPISVVFQHQVAWLWPTCETLHFAGLSLLLGVVGLFDLRLMGFMKRVPISVVKDFMPWALAGFSLNLLTGVIFVVSEPARYFANPTWWLKVTFLIIAGLNAFIFRDGLRAACGRAAGGRRHTDAAEDHRGCLADFMGRRPVGGSNAAVSGRRRRGRAVMHFRLDSGAVRRYFFA